MSGDPTKPAVPSFASSLKSYHLRKHMFDMTEADYYRFYSDPSVPRVPDGKIYITRVPQSDFITIYLSNGESHAKVYNEDCKRWMKSQFGLDEDRLTRSMDYLWNFYKVWIEL